jgi:hypothetical protein
MKRKAWVWTVVATFGPVVGWLTENIFIGADKTSVLGFATALSWIAFSLVLMARAEQGVTD